ncbi:chitinase-like protein PB1E7.04c isoform X2 [Athalia rosae]|nr:chitinase-like protein PB1E7.04c isoform X2 [Athalia rosae]
MTSIAHAPADKHEKIRQMLEDAISDDSKCRVREIYLQVEQLRMEEKLLLYLKFPASLIKSGENVDPLRQPLNPLGNRYEIHQTIMWIKTHLEEDPDVSLPKQEVYDEYNMFCIKNSMKPLSTADFGKVMKQVYPRVRPRRLGTRGNSRYCYAGMRKKIKLEPPTLPPVVGDQPPEEEEDITEEMLGAASTLIREWAESLLGLKFSSLGALARHLVNNFCVDTRSLAAVCILWAAADPQAVNNKEGTSPSPSVLTAEKPAKLREAQLQLQRKLQQREHIREQKHRHHDAVSQNQNKEKTVDTKGASAKGGKKNKLNQSTQGAAGSLAVQGATAKCILPAMPTGRHKKALKSSNYTCNSISLQFNCDNIVVKSGEGTSCNNEAKGVSNSNVLSSKDPKIKNPRKRANLNVESNQSESVVEKQAKLTNSPENIPSVNTPPLPKLTAIQKAERKTAAPSNNTTKLTKFKVIQATFNQPGNNCDTQTTNRSNNYSKVNGCQNSTEAAGSVTTLNKPTQRILQENCKSASKTNRTSTLDSDALDDYLNGGNNSQEQEEELLQYFQQSSSSSSDTEVTNLSTDVENTSRSDKVSQLRLILQQNLKANTKGYLIPEIPVTISSPGSNPSAEKVGSTSKSNAILSSLLNYPSQANTRRRVSFETNVIEHFQDQSSQVSAVPQSPNTRRRIFNFTPISPGPLSPISGRASKPSSANGSPFVSPRNTPVPRSRSNVQSGVSRSRSSQKLLSRSMSCSTPYTNRNDTFVVPTDVTRPISASQSPPDTAKLSDIQQAASSSQSASVASKVDQPQGLQTSNFLPTDLTPQKQLMINYPSQENLQEIKNANAYQKHKLPDQEISELFHSEKQFTTEQLFYRSQSVPLHRMVNPTLMSPLSTQHYPISFQSHSFNPSTSSSVAPTPVPSEFNDFGPISHIDNGTFLLNNADASIIPEDDSFIIGDKEISPENLTNIFNILDSQSSQSLEILNEHHSGDAPIVSNSLILNSLPSTHLNLNVVDILEPETVLDSSVSSTLQRIMQSRSYPNTPLPMTLSYASSCTDDVMSGSKSYPSTPLHPVELKEVYSESSEPMLSSLNLNSLQLHGETVNSDSSSNNACRNVTDLLETSFLADNEGETDNLDPLTNFDGLQDVDSLAPLFNEIDAKAIGL